MAVRKRTGFKGVSSAKLTSLKAQRDAANKRLVTANERIKVANERSKVAKKKMQKIKSKHRSKSIQKQRGVVKARGGGPARPASKLQGQIGGAMDGFFNPFPQAAAYQAPVVKVWSTVAKTASVGGVKSTKSWRQPRIKKQTTGATLKKVTGGSKTVIGQPESRDYMAVTGGDAFKQKRPIVAMTTDKGGQIVPDFAAAGEWFSEYIRIPIVGVAEKGLGQPKGLGKVIEERTMGIATRRDQFGREKLTVQAGSGKTKTYIHQSSRLEAGQNLKALKPSDKITTRLAKGIPPSPKLRKSGTPTKKMINLNKEWMNIGAIARAKALKAHGATTEKTVTRYGFDSLSDNLKKQILTKAGYKFD